MENIAINLLNLKEEELRALGFAFMVVGAIIAALTTNSSSMIERAPYFAYSALLYFTVSCAQSIWLLSQSAIAGGYLWVLTVVGFAISMAAGHVYCRMAMARSRDVHGHGRMAFLAFVPFANLWLLLTPSNSMATVGREPTQPLFTGVLGVLFGIFLLFAAGYVSVHIDRKVAQQIQQVQFEPESQQSVIELLIRSVGLEETLRMMAGEAELPVILDSATKITAIEVDGTRLRRTYTVDLQLESMSDEYKAQNISIVCAAFALRSVLKAGASIQDIYVRPDGSQIDDMTITNVECEM